MSTVGPNTSSASRGGRRRPPNLADDDLSHLEGLLALLRPQSYGAGRLLFAEGDPGDRVYVIRSGVVKLTQRGPGGRHNLIALAGTGDIVGEVAVFDPGPRTSTVLAIDDVDTGWLDRGALRRWVAAEPSAGVALLQLLARQVKRRHDQFAEQRVRDVEVRVARQLLDLAARFGLDRPDGSTSVPHVTDDELADLVGATSLQVAHVVAGLVDGGVVRISDAAVVLADLDLLTRTATRLG
jgi:CRP/FNR family transcriptional regulator, cyclic AMP receptor protein